MHGDLMMTRTNFLINPLPLRHTYITNFLINVTHISVPLIKYILTQQL